MAPFSYIGSAVVFIIAVSICGASPRPDIKAMKTTMDNGSLIPHWLQSAVQSVKQLVTKKNVLEDVETGLQYDNEQDNTFKAAEDSLPVLIHKEDEESGNKIISSTLSDTDKVNPFVRTKRSTCTTPANLPQMVKDLNNRLTASQFVGLNPADSTPQSAPISKYNSCPKNATGDWWPQADDNLSSTCPWKLQQVDLGPNAFPRYVNTAVCLCNNSCIGSPSKRCMEVTYDVTYFNRTGCENGLAVMEIGKHTVNVGCHCVSALEQTTIPNSTSE